MGVKSAARDDSGRKVGMWSAIADAVQSGWGSTVRLLLVLLALGIVLTNIAQAARESGTGIAFRMLLGE